MPTERHACHARGNSPEPRSARSSSTSVSRLSSLLNSSLRALRDVTFITRMGSSVGREVESNFKHQRTAHIFLLWRDADWRHAGTVQKSQSQLQLKKHTRTKSRERSGKSPQGATGGHLCRAASSILNSPHQHHGWHSHCAFRSGPRTTPIFPCSTLAAHPSTAAFPW